MNDIKCRYCHRHHAWFYGCPAYWRWRESKRLDKAVKEDDAKE